MRSITILFSLMFLMIAGSAAAQGRRGKGAAKPAPAPAAPAAAESAPAAADSGGAGGGGSAVRGPSRIDFDDRLIQGQTNKSGAVYLYDRKELKVRSMIKKRENFREEIIGSLFDT